MRWRFWIDRGGTFTDCIGVDPQTHELRVTKVLSSDDAPFIGIRQLLGLEDNAPLPPCELRLGTTLATNALLERRGAACALVVTRGFADLPVIGDQSRPDIFALEIQRPEPLHSTTIEVDGRGDPHGQILTSPDIERVRAAFQAIYERGIRSLAIAILHSYQNPTLERDLANLAHAIGFEHVSTSHDMSAELGFLARMDTAIVDAYLTPLLTRYVARLDAQLTPPSTLRLMQSSGGLVDGKRFRGRDAVLSGPAGGVVALADIARRHQLPAVIGFDMGGTSTDVCRWSGTFERVFETKVAGVRIRTPMMSIHTVAAGGGSLCQFDGHRLMVGPQSAGAQPGPLCYGHPEGSTLALTDINLALGRLLPDRFPFPLDRAPVDHALEALAQTVGDTDPSHLAQGLFTIAVNNMAQAIRQISIARGHDARDHAMVVFGGAGGQHACAVASVLGIRTLLFDPLGGVLSARGIGAAALAWHGEHDAGREPLGSVDLEPLLAKLEAQGRQALERDGADLDRVDVLRWADLRYAGTESSISVPASDPSTMRTQFEAEHRRTFGYLRSNHTIEVVTTRVDVIEPAPNIPPQPLSTPTTTPLSFTRPLVLNGSWVEVPVVQREDLHPHQRLQGPTIVLESTGTIVVEPGWSARLDEHGTLWVEDQRPSAAPHLEANTHRDPIRLEIMGNRFMDIAERMGTVLRRTALSTNIRERLDFSCAIFDRQAGLVANAPHMPVHLGAMSESVAAIAKQHPSPEPGDVFATNDPAAGGSHLPDITVVTPVHVEGKVAFYVASRGHHADVGGITPGSMPPHATTLDQEGVVFRGQRIVAQGQFQHEDILATLTNAPHPARSPRDNMADLEAQIAANHTGVHALLELCSQVGVDVVHAYMGHVQDHAAEAVERLLNGLPPEPHRFSDINDDGTPIVVTVQITGDHERRLHVDFTGTGPAGAHNLNAPRAVTVAAVLYVLRTLVGEAIPLNRGCMRSVDLTIPPGCLLDPPSDVAVAGGNVETAQRVVDVLFAAFDRKAASQGTMNNLTFGNDSFGYYETIGGGEGATEHRPGCSGVHTHMTNTRITDPEVLESRFPVRLHRFSLRPGSGGTGARSGGDGLVRELEFLTPLEVSILSDRRRHPPFGLHDGGSAATGKSLLNGEELPARAHVHVQPGDRLRIETPGGGGFGRAPK